MVDFMGSFYFDQTVNGNLIGEFMNNQTTVILTESATVNKITFPFEGSFVSTWFDTELHKATLDIKKNGFKFELKWTEPNKQGYIGEGFLTGTKLVGYYTKS